MIRGTLFFFILICLLARSAWAHGNLFEQASGATSACLDTMLKNEPKNLVRYFQSVQTDLTANEIFDVKVSLKNGQQLDYQAVGVEDKDDNFSWNCTKNQ